MQVMHAMSVKLTVYLRLAALVAGFQLFAGSSVFCSVEAAVASRTIGLATDLYGAPCETQPKENEIPVLEVYVPPGGCHFLSSFDKLSYAASHIDSLGLQLPPSFDPIQLYFQAAQEVVPIKVRTEKGDSFSGSGVIIGEIADKIIIATDDHVVNEQLLYPDLQNAKFHFTVTMGNNRRYTAQIELTDSAHDMIVISIKAAPELAQTYIVATFVDATESLGEGMLFGFAAQSSTLYASLASFDGLYAEDKVLDSFLDGEDRKRLMLQTIAREADGQSGGIAVTRLGLVQGLIDAWVEKSNGHRLIYVNPLTRGQVEEWLSKIKTTSTANLN
ncbi:MAG: trypsin-like peptidase domain-containing protein [Candidatus Obscuribacterales bacterium]|nr:trypsin-like peptidase domain-containing protein [Candidatus Obscuribacterales bacterium]